MAPWMSWDNTHLDFSTIDVWPAVLWRSRKQTVIAVELSRWAQVFCAFIFAYFGFAAEARKNYRLAFWAVTKRCGVTPPPNGALPFLSIRLPWTKPQLTAFATSSAAKSLSISLPLTPVKQRPDPLFGDSRTDCDTDAHSMEKGRGCEYILPSLSSSAAFSPPYYGAHDIEAGAYVAYPSSPSSSYPETDTETATEGQRTPSSVRPLNPDVDSPPRPRPTTWPSLHMPRPHAAAP